MRSSIRCYSKYNVESVKSVVSERQRNNYILAAVNDKQGKPGFFVVTWLAHLLLLGGLDILIDSIFYDGYNKLTNRSIDIGGNLSASIPEENCLQVSFPSTTSVNFCEKKEMLSFVVTLGEDFKTTTKGLLGTWNDNPDDDFTSPDGTVFPSSSSLREIHFEFGVKCKYIYFHLDLTSSLFVNNRLCNYD